MILVLERGNAEEVLELAKDVGDVVVYIPRPLPAEILERVAPFTREFRMPRSTWERLSKKAKEVIGERHRIESRRGRFAKIPVETIATILALHKSGVSIRKIAKEFGIPKSTVHYIIKKGLKVEDGDIKIIMDQ